MTDGYTNGSTPGTNGSTTFKGNGHDAEQVKCNRRDGGLLDPYDPEIEQRLLGMLLIENSAYEKVAGVLQAQQFGNALHARFYAAIGELIERGEPANPVTVRPFFEREPSLAIVGSKNYLVQFVDSASFETISNAPFYARRIVELSQARDAIAAAQDLVEALRDLKPGAAADHVAHCLNRLDEVIADDPSCRLSVEVHDAADIIISEIPPRGWLLGTVFCRTFLSGLIGVGSAGKTAIRYVQYLAAATGRDLTGERVHHRSRVLIVCLEDDLNEVKRRIGAAMLHHDIAPAEVEGWLFYATPKGLKLLQTDPSGVRTRGALYHQLRAIVAKHRIDLVAIDPFVRVHDVDENDNTAINTVMSLETDLAAEFDVAFDNISHARKGQTTPGDADSDRGASSKINAGRLMYTATRMSEKEAELYEVAKSDRPALVRVDDAKNNLTAGSPDAVWFKLIGVDLNNRTDLYPNGDNVQTVERWYPPHAFAKLDLSTIERILERIDKGPYKGGRYSASPIAKARAAWRVVHELCPALSEQQAKYVIATWLKTGVLIQKEHRDPANRHARPGLFVGKRPGDTWER